MARQLQSSMSVRHDRAFFNKKKKNSTRARAAEGKARNYFRCQEQELHYLSCCLGKSSEDPEGAEEVAQPLFPTPKSSSSVCHLVSTSRGKGPLKAMETAVS
ncbi:unnamed protein product [Ixodes pacificus]